MESPRLYLLIGYPGAGKTTIAEAISQETGAVHLWADQVRRQMFSSPSHSNKESQELYDFMNDQAGRLLGEGKSVVFDTNFNFYNDRQKLREIASTHQADTIIVWVNTSREVSEGRAIDTELLRNGYKHSMSPQQFSSIADKLEPPRDSEKVFKIDGEDFKTSDLQPLLG